MKNYTKRTFLFLFSFIFMIITIVGCERKPKFELVEGPTIMAVSGLEEVKSFTVTFNPEAYSIITINCSNGSKYRITQLDAAQTAAVLTILETEGIQFDTENEEFIKN